MLIDSVKVNFKDKMHRPIFIALAQLGLFIVFIHFYSAC